MYRFPQLEVKLLMGINLGAVDLASKVIFDADASWCWKVVAGLEIALGVAFIAWLASKRHQFKGAVEFEPSMNITQVKPCFKVPKLLREDKKITAEDAQGLHKALGLTKVQAVYLFDEVDQDDAHKTGFVDSVEYLKRFKSKKITWTQATSLERMIAFLKGKDILQSISL